MSDWIAAPDLLMKEALELVAGYANNAALGRSPGAADSVSDFPVALIDGLIEFFREAGGCDHSVGICCCAEEDAARELMLLKDGKTTCSVCGGDGYTWDADKYEAARVEAAKLGYDASEGEGAVTCYKCDGAGVTRIDADEARVLAALPPDPGYDHLVGP